MSHNPIGPIACKSCALVCVGNVASIGMCGTRGPAYRVEELTPAAARTETVPFVVENAFPFRPAIAAGERVC